MTDVVYINGEFYPHEQAKISVFDRGFLFGDSVYEVIPVYNKKIFFADRHIARLQQSLACAKMKVPTRDWQKIFQHLINNTKQSNLQIYLQVTRGNQGQRKHDIDKEIEPSVVAFVLHTPYPSIDEKRRGLSAKIVQDIRWECCHIKTNSMLANVLMNDEAVSDGFDTALLERDGYVTEGASSNVFVVIDDEVFSPPIDNRALPGVTQQIALEIMHKEKWPVHVGPIAVKSLFAAQEVWISSTTKEIFPVTKIDNHTVGNGHAGPIWQKIDACFQQLKTINNE